jgi:hypothetical protein
MKKGGRRYNNSKKKSIRKERKGVIRRGGLMLVKNSFFAFPEQVIFTEKPVVFNLLLI